MIMMVTFVSQCQKKALNRTRRVLDAFANRIGDNTWQTVITEDGLIAVKKLLRKTATKNTAVSCHWIRSRARSELVWVVGNRNAFNESGFVPVNWTSESIEIHKDSTHWKTLPLIRYAVAIAGLFHDFGKANVLFQNKLNPNISADNAEPYRHEWVSLRIFEGFVRGKSDRDWLNELAEVDANYFQSFYKDGKDDASVKTPPLDLEPFAQLVAWLILTHHKLPQAPFQKNCDFINRGDSVINEWLINEFNATWNSKAEEAERFEERVNNNWTTTEFGLPNNSGYWRSHANQIASKAASLHYPTEGSLLLDDLFTSHIARLCLMLADHYFSSLKKPENNWKSPKYNVYANTLKNESGDRVYNQQLDEHLIGVANHAYKIAKALPAFKASLPKLQGNVFLEAPCDKEKLAKFGWQDTAAKLAKGLAETTQKHGFFGVNMASTGCGKTLANAKIMYALGDESDSVRFSVALGLRTLTLQTGKEFQRVLDLSDSELAIAVGGVAVKALFEQAQIDEQTNSSHQAFSGSESSADILNIEQIQFAGDYSIHSLSEWTNDKQKIERLINAPVLCCTIDHLIPATEGTRGGQQIGPMLRLLSSDLVIDEPDDFGLEDLPALCRLVHWAGVLGSRVLLSTATMPPALVYACYQAYQNGWSYFAKANLGESDSGIQCAWFDELQKPHQGIYKSLTELKDAHQKFVGNRISLLKNNATSSKRKGLLVPILEAEADNRTSLFERYAITIQKSILQLHKAHSIHLNDKKLSIGLVRMANITPLVNVATSLFKINLPEDADTVIHYCVYHSSYPLAVRSHIEYMLDKVLNRKNEQAVWSEPIIKEKLECSDKKNHIFVVIASPVAEVGRDHDYDWAIVEPSSMRSIIQIAGRVLRHRDKYVTAPNLHLLSQNIKSLKNNNNICFTRPGFESENLQFTDGHKLDYLISMGELENIDAVPRITYPVGITKDLSLKSLVELEHKALIDQLSGAIVNPKPANIWFDGKSKPHWCGEVQKQQRFRKSDKQEICALTFNDSYAKPSWQMKDSTLFPAKFSPLSGLLIDDFDDLKLAPSNDQWFELNPHAIFEELAEKFNISLREASERFGEVSVRLHGNDETKYFYHNNLGLYKI
jgi:CRISPR-associated endonuclease/helicase Cas3